MYSNYMPNQKTTIIIESKTRDRLRTLGRKEQTYDDIINELIGIKRKLHPEIDPVKNTPGEF